MLMPAYFWMGLLAVSAILVAVWWARTQYVSAQRRSMRAFYRLSEDIFAASSPAEIAEKLAAMLPSITQATTVSLYLLNHRTKSLESVPTTTHPEPMAASIEGEQEGLAAGAVKCFRNRALVNIPDVRRNPLVNSGWKAGLPRSVMFVPLLAHDDTLGVIEAGSMRRLGYFTPDEQATVQHLAKQVAASLKLQEQKEVREQLFRSEKLAATGQLISGVASDLRAPLDRMLELSSSLEAAADGPMERGLRQLSAEVLRVSEIVARLVSFARPAEATARLVDVNALVAGLVQFREPESKALGLRVQNRLAPESAFVLGVQGQMEEVYLNLLVYAEQCASRTDTKTLEVTSSRIAGRVVVEIRFPGDLAQAPASDASLDVCRAIVQNHGGDLRIRNESGGMSFDVDFPLAPTAEARIKTGAAVKPGRIQTFLLVDSDLGAQRQLLGLLTARGHRVVPVRAEEAADLAHRMRFDAVVWAVRPGGVKWGDFHERLREAVPSFVLVSDGYDAEFAASLAENGGFLLGRPIQDAELDRVLQAIEARAGARV
jgi:signal transduction histidine kinase